MKYATMQVDLDAILYNFRHLKCYYKKNIIAVLKDDAYGVGLLKIANLLRYEEGLIVALSSINEVLKLRENNFDKEILYLNVFDETDLEIITKNDITVIVENLNQLALLKNKKIKFHLKLNTGMNRLGLSNKDATKAIDEVNKYPKKYQLTGVLTHFADDDKDHFAYDKFKYYVEKIKKENLVISCFASSSLNEKTSDISNYLRVGLKLYGIGERCSFLHNALTLTSPILTIKTVNKHDKVGYDCEFECQENGNLYILPIGYGQGWGRFTSSLAYNNYRYLKQAGKISMDYSTYFGKEKFSINDEFELFGKNIPLEILCKNNYIDPHEVLVRLKVNKIYNKKSLG